MMAYDYLKYLYYFQVVHHVVLSMARDWEISYSIMYNVMAQNLKSWTAHTMDSTTITVHTLKMLVLCALVSKSYGSIT